MQEKKGLKNEERNKQKNKKNDQTNKQSKSGHYTNILILPTQIDSSSVSQKSGLLPDLVKLPTFHPIIIN